ncbi:MAG: hypothetical protein WCJ70_04635 [bacterium]
MSAYMRYRLIAIASVCVVFLSLLPSRVEARSLDFYDYVQLGITPVPCGVEYGVGAGSAKCPTGFTNFFTTGASGLENKSNPAKVAPTPFNSYKFAINAASKNQPARLEESCAVEFDHPKPIPGVTITPIPAGGLVFSDDTRNRHYWAEDPEITALGKANDRARQFLFWVMGRPANDDNPKLKEIWAISRNVAISFIVLTAALMGIWITIAHRLRYRIIGEFGVWESISKIVMSLLFISLSASIVLVLIQLSEILMKFFIEALAGKDLFNVYFGSGSTEANYVGFIGCRDLNIRANESIDTQVFLLRLTNITYYIMGVMLILRKILLWFLLFVSPFLPILLNFPLIRNTGKIWIGVFFQWLMYGPLFALFLGATGAIWKYGIPFPFDFSRINSHLGYVFPNAIMIVYGGPAQIKTGAINAFNSGNYVDTFVEYVISLIMLWAVIFFPWWLLRIFRDYCCEAIMAMGASVKNLADTLHPVPPPKPPPPVQPVKASPQPTVAPIQLANEISRAINLGNATQVRQAQTAQIASAMSLKATTLKDVAKLEANKNMMSAAKQSFAMLQNPLAATTTSEREKYLNVRTELFTRASSKNDAFAKSMLATASTSSTEHAQHKQELIKSVDAIVSQMNNTIPASLSQISSQTSNISTERIGQITNTVMEHLAQDMRTLSTISTRTTVPIEQVKSILKSYAANITQPLNQIVEKIASVANTSKQSVKNVLQETNSIMSRGYSFRELARTTGIDESKSAELLSQIDVATATTGTTSPILIQAFANEKVSSFIKEVAKRASTDEVVMTHIQSVTSLSHKQIESTLLAISSGPSITDETMLTQIQTAYGVDKVKTLAIVKDALAQTADAGSAVPQSAVEGESVEQASVLQDQLNTAVNPESQIDQIIPVPADQSLDEYEEIRELWVEQYEKEEVPLSEQITSRADWVSQDITLMTNILNKLLSADQTMRQQALDEVGFILPIFLINNLSGSQLLTYLKAKLSAAKQVQKAQLKKDAQVVTPVAQEEFVDVARATTEQNQKHLVVDEEGESKEAVDG